MLKIIKKLFPILWAAGFESSGIMFAYNLNISIAIFFIIIGLTPFICSCINAKEATRRTQIVEDANTKRLEITLKNDLDKLNKLKEIVSEICNSLPPDELNKQNIDNLIFFNNQIKQSATQALAPKKYKAETSPPAHNDSSAVSLNKDELNELVLQIFSLIKDGKNET